MALPVLILGESGTGKSASLRNFDPKEIKVINVEGKPLPFKNKFENFTSDNYVKILKEMQATKKPVIVVDDAQYLMANEFMRRATERGYDKFTEIAQNFWNLINKVKELPKEQIVYFMAHIERDVNGNEKIKTIGKLLDEKITVEGMFTIVLKTNVNDGAYTFITQNSGHDTVKSPIGMFPSVAIDNDLRYVDDKIRNYYEIGEFKSDAEMAEEDRAAEAEIPVEKKRVRRGKKAAAVVEQEIEEQETESPIEEEIQAAAEEKPAKRSRRSLTAEREEAVKKAQAEVAQTDITSEDQNEEVPFKETEEPKVTTEIPKRKRRTHSDEPVEDSTPIGESTVDGEPVESGTRRRRRRG